MSEKLKPRLNEVGREVLLRVVGNSLVITIPREVVSHLDWAVGERLQLTSDGEELVVRKVED